MGQCYVVTGGTIKQASRLLRARRLPHCLLPTVLPTVLPPAPCPVPPTYHPYHPLLPTPYPLLQANPQYNNTSHSCEITLGRQVSSG